MGVVGGLVCWLVGVAAMPSDQILKSYFMKYDKSGDGDIGKKEFKDLLYDLGVHIEESQADLKFDIIDHEGSGQIDFEEFKKFFKPMLEGTSMGKMGEALETADKYPEWMTWLIENWRWYDQDRSGTISQEEFQALMKDFPWTCGTSFSAVDKDGDGSVDFNEFMDWVWENYDSFA